MDDQPFKQCQLILAGGGHSHALVLRQLAMNPLPETVDVALISDVTLTPYSGMLPGELAGTYSHEQTHIDLRRLCAYGRVRFIKSKLRGIDPEARCIRLEGRPDLFYDFLSLNLGSTPNLKAVPGASEGATPVKPVPIFLAQWQRIKQAVGQGQKQRIAIVGGGAAGVEIALAFAFHLGEQAEIFLIHSKPRLLQSHAPKVAAKALAELKSQNVQLYLDHEVKELRPQGSQQQIHFPSGEPLIADHVIWATGAAAPHWLKESGLDLDEGGFVRVDPFLRSTSHPEVFAAGDLASMVASPRPKSGVYAVRQGKPLLNNLRRALQSQPLKAYRPQRHFLSLINLQGGQALLSRSHFTAKARWVFRLKDHIDKSFMARLQHLPKMDPHRLPNREKGLQKPKESTSMRCHGCGAKLPSKSVYNALARLKQTHQGQALTKLTLEDAARLDPTGDEDWIQSVDAFPNLIDDPYIAAQIITHHALNDIYAMGGHPHSVQATITLPYAKPKQCEDQLYQTLSGLAQALEESHSYLIGGHSLEGPQAAISLVVNGRLNPRQVWQKAGAQPGDALILTKPLGTGVLFAAHMQAQCPGHAIDEALASMLNSHDRALQILAKYEVHAATDITGFGLYGHALEMARHSQKSLKLNLETIPALKSSLELLSRGWRSSLHSGNKELASGLSLPPEHEGKSPRFDLLFDPQTSGGLLLSIAAAEAAALTDELREAGYLHCAKIGEVMDFQDPHKEILLS